MDEYVLLAFFIGFLILSGITALRALVVYSRKDEKNRSIYFFIKFLVVIGFVLCWDTVILLPIDVYYNLSHDIKKYVNIFTLYRSYYWACLVFIFFLTPITNTIYLEPEKQTRSHRRNNYDNNNNNNNYYFGSTYGNTKSKKGSSGLNTGQRNEVDIYKYKKLFSKILSATFFSFVLAFCLFFLTYLAVKKFTISLDAQDCKLWYPYIENTNKKDFLKYNIRKIENCQNIVHTNIKVNIDLHFNDYIVIFMLFVGLHFFSFYVAIGLVSFPLSLIRSYIYRKKKIKEDDFKYELSLINRKATRLMNITEMLQTERKQIYKVNYCKSFIKYIKYKRQKKILSYMVHKLEKDYENLLDNYNNPTNKHFVKNNLIVISMIIYTLIASYMLICALSGFIYFCSELHLGLVFALEKKDTYLNSFLLNICLFFFVSSGAALFSTKILNAYSRRSHAIFFFDLTLRKLGIIGQAYANNALLYFVLVVNLLTVIVFFFPKKCSLSCLSVPSKFFKISDEVYDGQEIDLESNTASDNIGKHHFKATKLFK
ncbi:conserved Plasmodium protein, unknown function [Plasmodium malariae]|uniref:LMBR1 domain-containing protein n=1 Tax=Plasmodium malariae TaxID=5858 RepID=A0A1C3KZN6_PLAMA|nr:conserved Plasmodium protein, unknown function [Plasmodium malariae]